MPAGTAATLRLEMQTLVDDLANEIPALFESEEYQTQRRAIEQELGETQEAAMADFTDRAKAENVALVRTPMGFMLTAIRDGKLVKAEDFEARRSRAGRNRRKNRTTARGPRRRVAPGPEAGKRTPKTHRRA